MRPPPRPRLAHLAACIVLCTLLCGAQAAVCGVRATFNAGAVEAVESLRIALGQSCDRIRIAAAGSAFVIRLRPADATALPAGHRITLADGDDATLITSLGSLTQSMFLTDGVMCDAATMEIFSQTIDILLQSDAPAADDSNPAIDFAFSSVTSCPPGFEDVALQPLNDAAGCLQTGASPPRSEALTCVPCLPGSYRDAADTDNACNLCAAGAATDEAGRETCDLCRPGHEAPTEGSTVCTACDPGTAASGDGNPTCTPCAPGSYQNATGQEMCILCAPGTAQPDDGQRECIPCSPGSSAASDGATDCAECDPGFYANVAGMAECLPCRGPNVTKAFVGEVAPLPGSVSCSVAVTRGIGRTDLSTCNATVDQCAACKPGRLLPDCKQIPVYLESHDSLAIFFQTLAAICILLTLSVAVFLYRFRGHPVVTGASLPYCWLLLVGILMGFCSPFLLIGRPTAGRCNAFHWVDSLGFGLIMSNLLFKFYYNWRVFALKQRADRGERGMISKAKRSGGVTVRRVTLYAMLVVAAQAVVLGVAISIYPIATEIRDVEGDSYSLRRLICEDALPVKFTELVMDLVYLLAGFFLAYKTRKIKLTQYGESHTVIYVLMFSGVLAPALALSLGMAALARLYFDIAESFFTNFLALTILFGPKVYAIVFDEYYYGDKPQTRDQLLDTLLSLPKSNEAGIYSSSYAVHEHSPGASIHSYRPGDEDQDNLSSHTGGDWPHSPNGGSAAEGRRGHHHPHRGGGGGGDNSSDAADSEGEDVRGGGDEMLGQTPSAAELEDFVGTHHELLQRMARLSRDTTDEEIVEFVSTALSVVLGDKPRTELDSLLDGARYTETQTFSFRKAQESMRRGSRRGDRTSNADGAGELVDHGRGPASGRPRPAPARVKPAEQQLAERIRALRRTYICVMRYKSRENPSFVLEAGEEVEAEPSAHMRFMNVTKSNGEHFTVPVNYLMTYTDNEMLRQERRVVKESNGGRTVHSVRSNDGQRTSVGDLKRHRSHDPALIPRRHQSAGAEKTGGESQKTTTSLRETPKSAGKAARRSSSLRNEEHPADRVALANEALARERSSPYKQGNQQPPAATARFPAAGPASVGEFLLATAGDVSPQVPHKKKQPAVAPKPGQRQPPHRVDFSMSPPAGAPPKPGIVDSEAESENEETTLT